MHSGLRARSRFSPQANPRCDTARTLYRGARHPGPFVPGVKSRRRPAQSESRIRASQRTAARDSLKRQGGIYRGGRRDGSRGVEEPSLVHAELSGWSPFSGPSMRGRAGPEEQGGGWGSESTHVLAFEAPVVCRWQVSLRTGEDRGSNQCIPPWAQFLGATRCLVNAF